MCFGNNSAKKEAERARLATEKREAERRAAVLAGRAEIDGAFSQFNDAYYGDLVDTFQSAQGADLESQYADAAAKIAAHFAGRGLSQSSVANDKSAELAKTYGDEQAAIANRAADAANAQRANIERSKSGLYDLNSSVANPQEVAARATATLSAIQAPQTVSPLAQVFAAALAPLSTYQQAANNSPGAPYASKYGKSSGKVID